MFQIQVRQIVGCSSPTGLVDRAISLDFIMDTTLKHTFLTESSQVVNQIGNTFVLHLWTRIREIEALTRTLAAAAEQIPKSEALFHQIIPTLLNFQDDFAIAGGGVWFQPYLFNPEQERQSFFWGRTAEGNLTYFDDYNRSDSGYDHEAWYVVGHYVKAGQCFWSKSYIDPYSHELMITCTSPFFIDNCFAGVVTVDLKLDGLQAIVDTWRQKTGGYIMILDWSNQFISFSEPTSTKIDQYNQPNPLKISTSAFKFAAKQPLFEPLLGAIDQMNRMVAEQAQQHPTYQQEAAIELSEKSCQISQNEGELLAAIMTDPLADGDRTDHLQNQFELEQDWLFQEASVGFLFHVPQVYWKVLLVKPQSEVAMATHNVIQADKLASLGQMVAGIAHEVNNPLNFIVGNLTHAKQYTEDLLKLLKLYQTHNPTPGFAIESVAEAIDLEFLIEDLPKLISSMQMGADRALQITLLLRNFSRQDQGDQQQVDLHQTIDNTLLILQSRLKPKSDRPAIQVVKAYEEIPEIVGNPGQLSQVLMNLCVNAIDALEEKTEKSASRFANDALEEMGEATANHLFRPTLSIYTSVIDQEWVRIQVADNGGGIPLAVQQRLFDPFFTTKPTGKGTGLGLAICHQIITEYHEGHISCDSVFGEGATFVIQLPINPTLKV